MQDAVHRLLCILLIHTYRFLCNLLPELSTQFVPIISGFSTFFSYFTKAGIPNALFLVAPHQFMLFSFVVPIKSDFTEDPCSLSDDVTILHIFVGFLRFQK